MRIVVGDWVEPGVWQMQDDGDSRAEKSCLRLIRGSYSTTRNSCIVHCGSSGSRQLARTIVESGSSRPEATLKALFDNLSDSILSPFW